MKELHEFFAASVGAAAALIGLLFVAITVAPERTFGVNAEYSRQRQAEGSFIALSNVLFVSFAALSPHAPAAIIAVVAAIAIAQTIAAAVSIGALKPERAGFRRFWFAPLAVYALELYLAVRLWIWSGPAEGLVYTVLALYAYSLGSAWALLGARDNANI